MWDVHLGMVRARPATQLPEDEGVERARVEARTANEPRQRADEHHGRAFLPLGGSSGVPRRSTASRNSLTMSPATSGGSFCSPNPTASPSSSQKSGRLVSASL